MGFLDKIKTRLRGQARAQGSGGGHSGFGGDAGAYWIYAQCGRCGELLKARINLMNDPSLDDEGSGWIVRKGLIGSGANRCFQSVEVTLRFDARKQNVIAGEAVGGKLITAEDYAARQRATSNE